MRSTRSGAASAARRNFLSHPSSSLLWRAYLRTGQEPYRKAVTLSLTRMCQGGIYDHLGGGFARYSTDQEWLAPHFEKMLYDNAQLVDLLSLVWQHTGDPLYRVRLEETVDWVLREMVTEDGAFASTLDVDSEGEEGKFYVWSEDEIDRLLGADADVFKTFYDVTSLGNWEGSVILNRRHQDGLADAETEAALLRARQRLLEVRNGRIWPGWDDKVLAELERPDDRRPGRRRDGVQPSGLDRCRPPRVRFRRRPDGG